MMEKTDSSSALLLLQYGDSDEETSFEEPPLATVDSKMPEDRKNRSSSPGLERTTPQSPSRRISEESLGKHAAGLISDEETDHMPDRKRLHEEDEEGVTVVPLKLADVSKKMAPSVSPYDDNSSSSLASQHSNSKPVKKTKPSLVSYVGGHESGSEDKSSDDSEDDDDNEMEINTQINNAASVPKVTQQDSNNIQLPLEPTGRCSKELQDKIAELYMRMKQQGFDTNREIQNLTSFRNPSIYEKLIQMHHIDEKGSNFPLEVYDPHIWGKESFFDELDKAQKKDMERREKERKTKIEFISGTKKSSSATAVDVGSAGSDDKKRKSKWDALPAGLPQNSGRSLSAGAAANLTTTATGTRATVISAVGTLSKKNTFSIINTVTK